MSSLLPEEYTTDREEIGGAEEGDTGEEEAAEVSEAEEEDDDSVVDVDYRREEEDLEESSSCSSESTEDSDYSTDSSSYNSDYTSSSSEDEMKTTSLSFSGDHGEFEDFMEKWTARALKKGYHDHLETVMYEDLPEEGDLCTFIGVDEITKKRQQKCIKKHTYALADLQEACVGDSTRGIRNWIRLSKGVLGSQDRRKYPHGRMHIIMTKLYQHFRGKVTTGFKSLLRDLNDITMKEGDHPDVVFNHMWKTQEKFAHQTHMIISPMTWVDSIVEGCSDCPLYAATFVSMKSELEKVKTDPQDILEALERRAMELYANDTNRGTTKNTKTNEIGLFQQSGGGGKNDKYLANMECFECGKKGHKAYACPDKKSSNTNTKPSSNYNGGAAKKSFQGKCNLCHKTGHMAKDCFEKEENASRRPTKWKTCLKDKDKEKTESRDTGQVSIQRPKTGEFEFSLIQIEAPIRKESKSRNGKHNGHREEKKLTNGNRKESNPRSSLDNEDRWETVKSKRQYHVTPSSICAEEDATNEWKVHEKAMNSLFHKMAEEVLQEVAADANDCELVEDVNDYGFVSTD